MRESNFTAAQKESWSLNPYSNGIYSMRHQPYHYHSRLCGLNPYSNGIYSMSCTKRKVDR